MNELTPEVCALVEQAKDAFHARMGEGADKGQFYFDGFVEEFSKRIIESCIYICEFKGRSLQNARLVVDDFNEKNCLAAGESTAITIAKMIKERFGV